MEHKVHQVIALICVCLLLAACSSAPRKQVVCSDGVCTLAPRKATSRPYAIKGIWYHPQAHYEYEEEGIASYYGGGDIFHGRPTATGETFDMNEITAAHKTLPLPCIAEVTNLENGRQIQLKVNDRGPFIRGRIIDVSRRVAQLLGFEGRGTAKVRVRTLVPESLALNGLDSSNVMLAEAKPQVSERADLTDFLATMEESPSLPDSLFEEADNAIVLAEATPSLLDAPEPTSSSKGIFVDVGAYESHKEATAVSRALDKFSHLSLEPIKKKGLRHYAVRLGPLNSMFHANQVLDQLANAGHLMSRIVIHH